MDPVIIAAIVSGIFIVIAAFAPSIQKKRKKSEEQIQPQHVVEAKPAQAYGRQRKIVVDFSHRQSEWRGFDIFHHLDYETIRSGVLEEYEKLEHSYSYLTLTLLHYLGETLFREMKSII